MKRCSTTYKTKDGKSLGHWVNMLNGLHEELPQRRRTPTWLIAGSNGTFASTYLTKMLENPAFMYKDNQTRYQMGRNIAYKPLRSRLDGRFAGRPQNLGRWVNRQRLAFELENSGKGPSAIS
jgi:hypothetical protein